jgi:hypothetical protein
MKEMSGSTRGERRSAERHRVALPTDTDRGPGITRDVSLSGLYLVTEERLPVGARLELLLSLRDGEHLLPLRLAARGRVVRVEEVDDRAGLGIAFDDANLCWAT